MSVNKVILVGNAGSDAKSIGNEELSMAIFSVATNEVFKDKAGAKQERTEWHKIVTFGKLADTCNSYIKKGKELYIEGKIRTRVYKDKEQVEHKVFEIVADTVRFLGSSKKAATEDVAVDDIGIDV